MEILPWHKSANQTVYFQKDKLVAALSLGAAKWKQQQMGDERHATKPQNWPAEKYDLYELRD